MKMILTPATTPDEYIDCLSSWQQRFVVALRNTVRAAAPELQERLKWGHLVYLNPGPVLIIRAEPTRVLFGFFRGQRLRHIEPRLKPGGKYEMATLELRQDTPLAHAAVVELAREAARLNRQLGDPTEAGGAQSASNGQGNPGRGRHGSEDGTKMKAIHFAPLHGLAQHIPLVARWLGSEWPAWYGPAGQGNALADAQRYAASAHSAPLGLIALLSNAPIGFGALKTEAFPTHPELGPWVGAGFVLPEHRGQGLGGQLLQALVTTARALGHHRIYCATATAATLLQRCGWVRLAQVEHDAQPVSIFASTP